MAQLTTDSAVFTAIEVFTVSPTEQRRLAGLLVVAAERAIRHQAGFVSIAIHRSLDDAAVVSYSQWTDRASYEAARAMPEVAAALREARALATEERRAYEVVYVASMPPAGALHV